jgi:hypothetical protein
MTDERMPGDEKMERLLDIAVRAGVPTEKQADVVRCGLQWNTGGGDGDDEQRVRVACLLFVAEIHRIERSLLEQLVQQHSK